MGSKPRQPRYPRGFCHDCQGSGKRYAGDLYTEQYPQNYTKPCPACGGTGRLKDDK